MTKDEAQKQLKNIEASLNRAINQIRGSCIDEQLKGGYVDDLNEMAFEIHHLTPYESAQQEGKK